MYGKDLLCFIFLQLRIDLSLFRRKKYVHCLKHIGVRLFRIPDKDGWWCPEWGPSVPGVILVDTIE
jgi:hypothetical protein